MDYYRQPLPNHKNKFVITEEAAFFAPYLEEFERPWAITMLSEIFDLDDEEVFEDVDRRIYEGTILLGSYDAATEEILVDTPLDVDEYVQRRLQEVFGTT